MCSCAVVEFLSQGVLVHIMENHFGFCREIRFFNECSPFRFIWIHPVCAGVAFDNVQCTGMKKKFNCDDDNTAYGKFKIKGEWFRWQSLCIALQWLCDWL